MTTFTADFVINTSSGPSVGPAVTGSFVNANFTALTGKTVVRELFGVSTAALLDGPSGGPNFAAMANTGVQTALRSLSIPLLRFNCNSGGNAGFPFRNTFPSGPGSFNSSVWDNFTNNLFKCVNTATTKIIINCGFVDNGGLNTADFATCCSTLASYLRTKLGGDGVAINAKYWEIFNEVNLGASYNTFFNAAADAIHGVDSTYVMTGPASAGDYGQLSSLIGASNTTRLGMGNVHQYQYCPGSDGTPSDFQICSAQNSAGSDVSIDIANNVNGIYGGGYMAGKPFFAGEYNIGCGPDDARSQDIRGGCMAASWLMKMQAAANMPVWGGIWEAYQDGNYGLVGGAQHGAAGISPQGFVLSKMCDVVPGALVTCSGGGIMSWATVNSSNMAVVMVNPNTSPVSGQVALSHWPINPSGTSTIHRWEISNANINGAVTSLAVTAGLTASTTIPAQSVVILYP